MEHRKRHLNQHKVELSTQTRIVILHKGITGKPVVGSKDIITALALAAMRNAARQDAHMAPEEPAEIF